tara:strand:- start:521 stop:649 length:129 start_codon:yes stop_codon:yes gene_type:complete
VVFAGLAAAFAEAAVQLPVVQNLNGEAQENDFIAAASVRMNF